ncbi:hemolysin activation protein [Arsenophonus sp. ENCA]|uniref:Hha/YmoA family nucleoid-associated regulatory protein n=1 Tax=Arsenophonus sp. ENCA TaxID=1987579 RepID=UPI000BD7959F|nr:Hha/YmoA family nucleoid-associated regulatory protein [Arsenophonus sp. ENCA]PAV02567.1 hemolysin activation protein [Arsenophonus sp. ENCA]
MKTKQQWLLQFRRCSNEETLYKIAERISKKISGDEYANFQLAVDHRLAEIRMNTLYDKVPASVWKYVR